MSNYFFYKNGNFYEDNGGSQTPPWEPDDRDTFGIYKDKDDK